MWRRLGLNGLSVISLLVAVAVVISLAVLVYVLLVPRLYSQSELVRQMLVVCSVLSLISIVCTVIYQAGYFSYSESHQYHTARQRERWLGVWNAVLFNKAPLPRTSDTLAADALMLMKEGLDPSLAEKARHTYEMSGLLQRDMRVMNGVSTVLQKVKVIERWTILCDEKTHPTLIRFCHSRHAELRRLALSALARSMSVTQTSRNTVARTFEDLLSHDRFSSGWIEQVLVLLDQSGIQLLRNLLRGNSHEMQLHALHALVYIKADECLDECLELLHSPNADIRASSLKVLATIKQVPSQARQTIMGLLDDPVWYVRAQAALASSSLQEPQVTTRLYQSLADEAWWVRHNSAVALLELGPEGQKTLMDAYQNHPDRYARDMASQYVMAS